MKKLMALLTASALAASVLSAAAFAKAPQAKHAAKAKAVKAAAILKCPSCGMPMSQKKTAGAPVPVKVKGTTYYCCAACPSGKAALAAMKTHKPAVKHAAKKA